MSVLANIVTFLTADLWTTLFTLIIGFVVYKLAKFYVKVYTLPPGPIPLPLLGNILYFLGKKEHWSTVLDTAADQYGPIFTMWVGAYPVVFISDIDIAREVFRKNELAGRPSSATTKLFSNDKETDIIMADYGPRWEALRRVAHSAVLKYSTTDKLVYLVSDVVDHTTKTIIEKEGLDKPFDPTDYFYNIFLNIVANSAFGKRYELDDPEYLSFRYLQKDLMKDNATKFILWEFFPILTKIQRKSYNKVIGAFKDAQGLIQNKFKSHYKDFDESVIRDFCDTLISAKNDALREGKESAPYLTDENLSLVINDLFLAGTDTSQKTLVWVLFFLSYYPEVQKQLREEIESQIGDRIPTHEDRNLCHYVMACIAEALRLRNIAPNGVNHRAVVTTKIGEYTIQEDTQVTVLQGHILHNEKYWSNPKEFKPERFLEDGKYVVTRPKAFIPFGLGRRVCLGEKMAMTDMFLVLVRFLQATSELDIILHFDGPDTLPDPNKSMEIQPRNFKISLKKNK